MNIRYDFAFSFAGEDRNIVEEIKKELKGYSIFYDEDYKSELCGKDLYHYLREIYMNQATYVVCFISKYYTQKVWTTLEFSAIKERLLATFFASDFLIPIILDDNIILQDIPSFIGFYKHKDINDTVSLLEDKFKQSLNEDFYFENINHFSNYLLQKIFNDLKNVEVYLECNNNSIIIYNESGKKSFSLLPEDFTKLPCLLLYEDSNKIPSAIINWNRIESLTFSVIFFTRLSHNKYDNISLNVLIKKIENYLLGYER